MTIPIKAFFIVDSLMQNWTTNYRQMLKWLQGGKLTPQDSTSLHGYAMLCSDEQGDGVHVARAIMGQYNNVYYDTYDDCSDHSELVPRSSGRVQLNNINLYPNPSSGLMTLDFKVKASGKCIVYSSTGEVLCEVTFTDKRSLELSIEDYSGMTILKVMRAGHETIVKKGIIIR